MNELQTKLIEAIPAEQFEILDDDLWTWEPFPNFRSFTVLRFTGERVLMVRARKDGADLDDLVAVARDVGAEALDVVSENEPSVWFALESGTGAFGGIVIQHPSLAAGSPLTKDTSWIVPHVWTAVPAARCEVGESETADEAAARKRVWTKMDLGRELTPFTRTRSVRRKSNHRAGGAGKSRGVGRWNEVVRVLNALAEEDGFIEIENYERQVARVDHEGGYIIEMDGEQSEVTPEVAQDWLQAFATRGAQAAREALLT